MGFLKFTIKSAFRNKKRSALAVLSAGFSLFLLFSLQSFRVYLLNPPRAQEGDRRMLVAPTTSIMDSLPISHLSRIEKIPEIKEVMPISVGGFHWRDDPHYLIRAMAVHPMRFWGVFPDVTVPPEVKAEFLDTKTGALVGAELMKSFGWNVGDTVTLKGSTFPVDLELKIVGVYDWRFRSNLIFYRGDYLSDLRPGYNRTSMFWLMAESEEAIPRIGVAIDKEFRNSAAETRTDTERAFILSMMSRIGNITLLMGSIGAVVVFTMLIVTASNMALTMRERSREVGILKAIGYPWQVVLGLLLGEAAVLSLLGALVGAALSFTLLLLPLNHMTNGMISSFRVSPSILATTMLAGLGLGVASAIYPTVKAARIPVLKAIKPMD